MYKQLHRQEDAHEDSVWSILFIPRQQLIISGSCDSTIKIWDTSSIPFKVVKTLEGHQLSVISLDINASGTVLVSSSLDNIINLWDLEKYSLIKSIVAEPIDTFTTVLSPSGNELATGSHTGNVNIFDVATGEKNRALKLMENSVCMLLIVLMVNI